MRNIHRIFKKPAEYKPYEFAKVSVVALFWQLVSSILIKKFSLMWKYLWTWRFSFAWKIKSIVFLTMFSSHNYHTLSSIIKKAFDHNPYPMQKSCQCKECLIENLWRLDSYRVQWRHCIRKKIIKKNFACV